MLGRSAEGPQAAPQGHQASPPLSPHQTAEMSQKASDAFDAAAAGGLNNMAELKAVTSDIMSSQSRQDGTTRSPSPHMASVEHLSPSANLAMLQACVRWGGLHLCASLPSILETLGAGGTQHSFLNTKPRSLAVGACYHCLSSNMLITDHCLSCVTLTRLFVLGQRMRFLCCCLRYYRKALAAHKCFQQVDSQGVCLRLCMWGTAGVSQNVTGSNPCVQKQASFSLQACWLCIAVPFCSC